MVRHRGKILPFALGTALGLLTGQARAITITVAVNGGPPIDLGAVGFELPGFPGTSLGVDIPRLNAFLTGEGSGYQFSSLSATSNFFGSPGTSGGGTLNLSGQVSSAHATPPAPFRLPRRKAALPGRRDQRGHC
jgi:hypothetical protein